MQNAFNTKDQEVWFGFVYCKKIYYGKRYEKVLEFLFKMKFLPFNKFSPDRNPIITPKPVWQLFIKLSLVPFLILVEMCPTYPGSLPVSGS